MVPCISVLMPAYNAERFIRESVYSVLAQTFRDFELVVVNDGSQDRTPDILKEIRDDRLIVIHNETNLGIVESLNKAMRKARGAYIARADADDFCLPTRLARQKEFLDVNPEIALVGSEMFNLEKNEVRPDRRRGQLDPLIVRWMFKVNNPVGHPSMMFRASLIDTLGQYLRKEFELAEDLDFSLRVLKVGQICTLPEQLGIYRRHAQSLSHARSALAQERTAAVIRTAHGMLLGDEAERAASLIAGHFLGAAPACDAATLRQLGVLLDRLVNGFLQRHRTTPDQEQQILAHAEALWWRTLQHSLRRGAVVPVMHAHSSFPKHAARRPPMRLLAADGLRGVAAAIVSRRPGDAQHPDTRCEKPANIIHIGGVPYPEIPPRLDNPASLYVVVEHAAHAPAAAASGAAAGIVDEVQATLDRYGSRPIYLVDGSITRHSPLAQSLRRAIAGEECAIGVRLGAADEAGFGENADLPRRCCGAASRPYQILRECFGVTPRFVGMALDRLDRQNMELIEKSGVAVVFGIPGHGGRLSGCLLDTVCDRIGPQGIRVMSPARGNLFAEGGSGGSRLRQAVDWAERRRLSGIPLQRTIRAREETLVRSLYRRGHRTFILYCPATSATARGLLGTREIAAQIGNTCRLFFDQLGVLPGNPADLLPPHLRDQLRAQPANQALPGCALRV